MRIHIEGGAHANEIREKRRMPMRLPAKFQLYETSFSRRIIKREARCPSGIKHSALKAKIIIRKP